MASDGEDNSRSHQETTIGFLLLKACLLEQRPLEDYWIASCVAAKFSDFDGFKYWFETFKDVCHNGHPLDGFTSDQLLRCLVVGIELGLIKTVQRKNAKKIIQLLTSGLCNYRPKDSNLISRFYSKVVRLNANRYEEICQYRRISSERNRNLLLLTESGELKVKSQSASGNKAPTAKQFISSDYKAQRIARVMTKFDSVQMLALDICALVHDPKQTTHPFHQRFTSITQWFISLILHADCLDIPKILAKMLDLIRECLRLRNYWSAAAVLAVFSKTQINRLLPKFLKDRCAQRLAKYELKFGGQNFFEAYRDDFQKKSNPKIPQMQIVRTQIQSMIDCSTRESIMDPETPTTIDWEFVDMFRNALLPFIEFNRMGGYSGKKYSIKDDPDCEQYLSQCLNPQYFINYEKTLDRLSHNLLNYQGQVLSTLDHLHPRNAWTSSHDRKQKQRKLHHSSSGNLIIIANTPRTTNDNDDNTNKSRAKLNRRHPLTKSMSHLPTILEEIQGIEGLNHETSFMVVQQTPRDVATKKKKKKKKKPKVPQLLLKPATKTSSRIPKSPMSPKVDVLNWTNKQVLRWLKNECHLNQHAAKFKTHGITGEDLLELNGDDLDRMKITKIHDRKVITRQRNNLVRRSFPVS